MNKVRLGFLILILIMTNLGYYLDFWSPDFQDQELDEGKRLSKRRIPVLASSLNDQRNNDSLVLHEDLKADINEELKGFIGGFLENKGQKNDAIFYYTENSQMGVGFGTSAIYFSIINSNNHDLSDEEGLKRNWSYTTVSLVFLGSNSIEPIAEEPTGIFMNYFFGSDQETWAVNCQYHTKVIYYEIYDKIDLVYELKDGQLKYEFFVHPGGNLRDIKMHWYGPISLELLKIGVEITIHQESINGDEATLLSFIDTNPISYQSLEREKPIEGVFNIIGPTTYGFNIPTYNPKKLLIIDPFLNLTYSTYIGGGSNERGEDIVLDGMGNAFVTGYTYSMDFPTVNAYETDDGQHDIFVFKFNNTGNGLLYSTYVGGSDPDHAYGITLDEEGNAYVTGRTQSSDFPTVNAYNTTHGGSDDVFVFKLAANGSSLVYSTYVGGSNDDYGHSITLDRARNAYVTGYTASTDFPTVNPYETNDGDWDAFVFKLNNTGNGLSYSTYVGGSNYDVGQDIVVDSANNVYVTGYTASSDFPTVNPYETDDTMDDVFVFKLAANGSTLLYSTYVGGGLGDRAYGIVLDEAGNAYVTGWTDSTDFPTVNPYETDDGGRDVFVFKLANTGSTLLYSTYVGGSNDEEPGDHGIAIDALGNIYVTGLTRSTDFPPVYAYNSTGDGSTTYFDIFVIKLNNTGNGLLYSTYVAGTNDEVGNGIDLDAVGNVYIAGYTDSTNFPTLNAYSSTNSGVEDVCVVKLTFNRNPIYIDDNGDFQTLGFPGAGTPNDPFRIEGYSITNSTADLIHIQGTTAYFIIRYNWLDSIDGSYDCIDINNVDNGFIAYNTIQNGDRGIRVYYSTMNSFENNTLSHNKFGLQLYYSSNNNVSDNFIRNSSQHGFYFDYSSYLKIINNTITNGTQFGIYQHSSNSSILLRNTILYNSMHGIELQTSSDNNLTNNIIAYNAWDGIYLFDSTDNNTVSFNEIYNNSFHGIHLGTSSINNTIDSNTVFNISQNGIELSSSCDNNTLFNNTVLDSGNYGIYIWSSNNNSILANRIERSTYSGIVLLFNSINNSLFKNSFKDNVQYGISIDSTSNDSIIIWNLLINNNQGGVQASDAGDNNSFEYNFWNDWTTPDIDNDGFVDSPYSLDGGANNEDPYPLTDPLVYHSPIFISDDDDFSVLGFPGNGTISDPYVIEYYYFLTSKTNLIEIYNTTVYFIIQNCVINCINRSNLHSGIYLENVTHGLVTLNIILNCARGVYVNVSSGYNVISNNTAHNNTRGIQIAYYSDNNTISNNTLYDNQFGAMVTLDSNNCTISNNHCYNNSWAGIGVNQAGQNTVIDNTFQDDGGLYLFGWTVDQCLQKEVSNNVLNGRPIVFWQNVIGGTVPSGAGQIILVNCNNIIVENQNLSISQVGLMSLFCSELRIYHNNFTNHINEGIWLHKVINVTISDNLISYNGYDGILIYYGDNITISGNTIENNANHGIGVYWSLCTISGNTIYSNSVNGVYLANTNSSTIIENQISSNIRQGVFIETKCWGNLIQWNNFIGNYPGNTQAYDNGSINTFTYNHWNDWTSPDSDGDGIVDNFYYFYNGVNNKDTLPLVHPYFGYITRDPIYIDDSGDFITLGFPGSGTFTNPYLIEGYNITDSSQNLIDIRNTAVYFIVRNCLLNGLGSTVYNGIFLVSVSNGHFDHNIIHNIRKGVYMQNICHNNTFSNNTIYDCLEEGIQITSNPTACYDNIISSNVIYKNSQYGILISTAYNNTIYNNTIYDNVLYGIMIASAYNNTIDENILYNNSQGIQLSSAYNNTLIGNRIYNNSQHGIYLWLSHNNSFIQNTVANNTQDGINIESSSDNFVLKNFLINNTNYGVRILSASTGNTIEWNHFFGNNQGGTQAYDAGSSNLFTYNYWDDHTGPDSDPDGAIDSPYSIVGGSNFDPYPLMHPYILHDPILIASNAIFSAQGFLGEGTLNNPYIIEFLFFYNFTSTLLDIQNTTAYFIIRNCVFNGINGSYPGIGFTNVTFGTITDNIIYTTDGGIVLDESHNNTIVFNFIHNITNDGVYLSHSDNNSITYNSFYNTSQHGIKVESSSYNNLSNNQIYNNDETGISLYTSSNNTTILNNTIYNNAISGISFYSSHNNTVSKNIVYNSTLSTHATGISISNSTDNIIFNNTIFNNILGVFFLYKGGNNLTRNIICNNSLAGIIVWNGSSNNIIDFNTIYNNSEAGIELYISCNNNTLFNNTIYGHTGSTWGLGIFLYSSCSENNLTNNLIFNNSFRGIWLNGSCNLNIISNNTMYNNSNYNILLNNASHFNTIFNNTLYYSQNGIYFVNTNNNTLANNTIFYNSNNGIYLASSSHNNTFLFNKVYNNTEHGIHQEGGCQSNTYENNTIYFNLKSGFHVGGSMFTIISYNLIYNNSEYGIYLVGSSNNTLSGNTINNNTLDGITTYSYSNNNTYTLNEIYQNGRYGINLGPYHLNTNVSFNDIHSNGDIGLIISGGVNKSVIHDNLIHNNSNQGLHISFCGSNHIYNNEIFGNTWNGISITTSDNITVHKNIIYDNGFRGISVSISAQFNNFTYNKIINSGDYGIHIDDSGSINNTILFNIFLGNNQGSTQAYDDGVNNTFRFNHWDDHTSPDSDFDGYVDTAYLILGSAGSQDKFPRVYPATPHSPIVIRSDTDFITLGFEGAGTKADPYIIEGIYIRNSTFNLIEIENTTVFFIIRESILYGIDGSINGIQMFNTSNGYIFNNTITRCYYGIYLMNESENNIIRRNIITYNLWSGINFTYSCDNNSFLENSIHHNGDYGLGGHYSYNNEIIGNYIFLNNHTGIKIHACGDINISLNLIYDNGLAKLGNGISLPGSFNNTIFNNTICNNSWGGIGTDYANNTVIENNLIYNNTYRGIYFLASVFNYTVRNNNIYQSEIGLFMTNSALNNTIENNSIHHNTIDGIQIFDNSNFNNISNNFIFSNSQEGIKMASSHNNSFWNNTIYNNGWNGIKTESAHFNIIHNCTFYLNSYGIHLSASNNNTLSDNTIYNQTRGISLEDSSDNNSLFGNLIFNHSYCGITVHNSANNKITRNRLLNSIQKGVRIDSLSVNTTVTGNMFINNAPGQSQAYCDNSSNLFSTNYWADWTEPDDNFDGIIDLPYIIEGSAGLSDLFPVIYPFLPQAPITITEDSDFATLGFPGTGTLLDPYIIEGYNITSHLSRLIDIRDTSAYFIIRNCFIKGNGSHYGIYLLRTSHATIENNWIYTSTYGIMIENSSNHMILGNFIGNNTDNSIYLYVMAQDITIINNTLFGNGFYGIRLWYSPVNNITSNLIFNNSNTGINLENSSDSCIITANTIYNNDWYGINVVNSNYSIINLNTIFNNSLFGIYVWQSNQTTIVNNTITFNSNYGIRIVSSVLINISGNVIANNSINGLELHLNSSIVSYNILANNSICGIWLSGSSSHNLIFNNTMSHNGNVGFYLLEFGSVNNSFYNNSVHNSFVGITFYSTTANTVIDNLISNNSYYGIYLSFDSWGNNISRNQIWNNEVGIYLNNSHANYIADNLVYGNSFNGFVLNYSQNNVIFNNTITQNNEDGFHFYNTFNNTLTNNTVSYNNFEGISLKYSLNNTFINNTIFNNLFNGIKLLANSANNTFTGNKIHNNIASGIRLELANQNIFQNNTFYNNTYYTIFLENNTYGNFFKWNDFIGVHNIGGSHGYDDGLNNIFIYNWWEEHTGVDSEPDGYFDTPYSIDGDASNEDPYPLVSPNNPAFIHTLTIPIVLHPNGGEVLHGVITIQWTEATDSYGLQVTYTIYYSANNGIIWFELISDLTEISYSWDTTTLSNGTLYLVRVEATSNGLTESDDSNAPFTIQNPPISQTILITENADFETLGFEGDGTKGVPYIIEGLYIVDDSSTLIEIRNTAVYFIIRGNYLDGMYLESSGFGIYLFNVINGVIEDNHIYNCTEGIFIEACEHGDIEIFQNVIYSNSENGIYLLESNEINITANTIRHNGANGIFLNNSNDNIISSNTIYGNGDTGTDIGIGANLQGSNRGNGIFLDPADDNTIFNNSIYQNTENGIHLFESDDAQIANNTINDNGANGIFLEDSNSNIVTNNTIYGNGDTGTSTGIGANLHASNRGNGLFLDPADNNIISNNKIYENVENGIYILESKTTQIVNNWIFGNGFNAIFLELSNLNTIFNNILSALSNINIGLGSSVSTTTEVVATNRGNGIFLKVSSENNISSNEIRNNTNYGIVVDEDSSDNVIEWNDFYGNNPEGTSQAYDDGSNNRFAYNYWDDHINADTNGDGVADSHYEIDGDANNFDQFPMATPDGELIQIPPALDPLLFLVLILLILSVAGIGLAYVNRERIKRLIRKRTRKRPVREYDTLVDQAEELARSWEKDLKD